MPYIIFLTTKEQAATNLQGALKHSLSCSITGLLTFFNVLKKTHTFFSRKNTNAFS